MLVKSAALLAGAALLPHVSAAKQEKKRLLSRTQRGQRLRDGRPVVVHTACLGCNARCGMRAVVERGRLVEVSGNPFHPYNHGFQPVAYDTPVQATLHTPSPVCAKGKEAPNILYNPYRLLKPLKRTGERGSGKFAPIEWEQLIAEVADGGKLFGAIGDSRTYPGLRAYMSDEPIDPDAPELGSKRNGLVFIGGRDQTGYKDFTDRFVRSAFGSINRITHTDICGLGFRMGNFAFTEQKQVELKADPLHAEYILVFGANIYEALQPGVTTYGSMLAERFGKGEVKFVIIDPRATNASVHAHRWLAVKPCQDGALAMAFIRWIIENNAYDAAFLGAPDAESAKKNGRTCHSNATHLVIADASHPENGRLLRWGDCASDASEESGQAYVVLSKAGGPTPYDAAGVSAQLDAEGVVVDAKGARIKVKTAFRLLREEAEKHTIAEYAALCGIPEKDIIDVAREFSAHGHKAAVCQYHGAGNYTGGTYAAYAIAVLNALVGSVDMRGGYLKGGGGAGKWDEGLYDLKDFPGARKPGGVRISREKAVYEKSSEFARKLKETGSGYPAKRPWFAFTQGGLCVESLSGIAQKYPYQCGVLFTYYFNPVYSIPGGDAFIPALKDPDTLPLHVSIDVGINESNIYADYIVPGLTYLEGQYAFLTPHAPALKFTAVRTPVVAPLTGTTKDGRHFSLETFLIDLAEHLNLPGFGKDAIPCQDGSLVGLHAAEDYYVRGIANLAAAGKLGAASAAEVEYVEGAYPVAAHGKRLKRDEWLKVCRLLARGGVFTRRYEDDFDANGCHTQGIGKVLLYNEQLASAKDSVTGARFSGCPSLAPSTDSAGVLIEREDAEFPLTLVTHKMNVHAQSRSVWHTWSMELFPDNPVVLHPDDAQALGIRDRDVVHIVSRHCPEGVRGRARVSASVRPGCTAISFHYGHTQLGASSLPVTGAADVFLGGKSVCDNRGLVGDPALGGGTLPNKLGRRDGYLGGMPLVEVLSGIPDFSSTRVSVRKA